MHQISRRDFVALAATGVAAAPFALPYGATASAITAQEIVDRIKKQVGVEWKPETVDTFKAGDPGTVATGVVTTAMASMDVLKQAVKAGANVVITCEPTFFGRADSPTPPVRRGAGPGNAGRGGGAAAAADQPPSPPDRVFVAKADFLEKNKLVVWRFSDHWRLRKPDPLAQGLADALGWTKLTIANDPARVSVREMSLDALASHIKKTLNLRGGMRIVGDPATRVQKIALLPGSTPLLASLQKLPDVDVIVAGEVREWETVEYARDVVAAGGKKGLILLGRVASEDPGMRLCADWLKPIVPELKTTWIPVGDPYWRPL